MDASRARNAAGRRAAGMVALAAALGIGAGAAFAQGSIKVRLPDLSGLSVAESKALLQELARANVITSHCPGWEISPGEWMLLTATGDRLAARLGLDPEVYDRRYFGRAFRLLDDPRNCDRVGPEARPLLRRLMALGGSTEPVGTGTAAAAAAAAAANAPAAAAKGKPATGQGRAKAGAGSSGKGNPGSGSGNNNGNGRGGERGGNGGKGGGKGSDKGNGRGNGGGNGGGNGPGGGR